MGSRKMGVFERKIIQRELLKYVKGGNGNLREEDYFDLWCGN